MTYPSINLHGDTTKSLSLQLAGKPRFETGIPWIQSRVLEITPLLRVDPRGKPSVGQNANKTSGQWVWILNASLHSVCALSLPPTERKQMYLVAGRSVSRTNYPITCLGTKWWQSANKSSSFFSDLKKGEGGGGGGIPRQRHGTPISIPSSVEQLPMNTVAHRMCRHNCPSDKHAPDILPTGCDQ